jgi:hypothetical protein
MTVADRIVESPKAAADTAEMAQTPSLPVPVVELAMNGQDLLGSESVG